jgi:hypothetical protein
MISLTTMNVPTGFLVVRSQPDSSGNPLRYCGVDRVPPYSPHETADGPHEQAVLEQYVFGEYKDEATNVILSFERALQLFRSFSSSRHKYEIVFCSESEQILPNLGPDLRVEPLGYDVAAVRGDYWSIVDDFSPSEWASLYRRQLNEFGLFRGKQEARAYLMEYRERGEPDGDFAFDVVHVARIHLFPGPSR